MLCTAPAATADDDLPPAPPPPPALPWPTGCDSPLVLGGTPAARKWCNAPLFGPIPGVFGPTPSVDQAPPTADQPVGPPVDPPAEQPPA